MTESEAIRLADRLNADDPDWSYEPVVNGDAWAVACFDEDHHCVGVFED